MSWFMKMWLWIKKFRLPEWLIEILERILGVGLDILKEFTREEINDIQNRIMLEAKKDIPGSEKMANVVSYFRENYTREDITNRALQFCIEYFVALLTKQRFID